MKRRPVVAGQFYRGTRLRLEAEVAGYTRSDAERVRAVGVVSPHAGLMYSGAVAGEVFSRIEIPETFVLIGPNHTGLGAPLALMSFGSWEIPTGTLKIDPRLSEKLLEYVDPLQEDEQAHLLEHSLEVQTPFIVHFSGETRIVPIVMADTSLETCRSLGEGLAKAISQVDYPVTIVASSDMSHQVPDAEARRLDRLAINEVLDINPEGLHRVVRENGITMCGYAPVTAMLYGVKALGATDAELLDYRTSGEVSGDMSRVVGYAGIVIKAESRSFERLMVKG